jgi:hypothetical protein
MKLFKFLKIVIVLFFVFLLFIVLLPWGILGNLIDALFFEPGRMERFYADLKNNWMPLQKYIYLHYGYEDEELLNFIEKELLPKYEKFMVVNNPLEPLKDSPFKKSASVLYTEIGRDYDGDYDAILIAIDKNINPHAFYPYYDEKNNIVDLKKTKKYFVEKIEECLKEWGVKVLPKLT